MSQFNYESGRRKPGANYLAAVAARGIDVYYVLGRAIGATEQRVAVCAEVTLLDDYRQLHGRRAHQAFTRRPTIAERSGYLRG